MKDLVRISTMSLHPVDPESKERQRAGKVAEQFEAVFVRSLVSSLRQTASLGDESMFGAGPGADTYGDWFDQNLAEQISHSGRIGIAEKIMKDFEHDGAITKTSVDDATKKVRDVNAANNHNAFAAMKVANGGLDVLL